MQEVCKLVPARPQAFAHHSSKYFQGNVCCPIMVSYHTTLLLPRCLYDCGPVIFVYYRHMPLASLSQYALVHHAPQH
jgi:hypothetical protein